MEFTLLGQHQRLKGLHVERVEIGTCFSRWLGAVGCVTPKEYAAAHRDNLVRKTLSKSDTVTDAIYDADYNSNSRLYVRE